MRGLHTERLLNCTPDTKWFARCVHSENHTIAKGILCFIHMHPLPASRKSWESTHVVSASHHSENHIISKGIL